MQKVAASMQRSNQYFKLWHGNLMVSELENLCFQAQGVYQGIEALWLRWVQPDGVLLLMAAEQAQQQAEQAEAQVLQIARNLLQTGMPAIQIAQITGQGLEQIEALVER